MDKVTLGQAFLLAQYNFDYPSPGYPPVSISHHGGEPLFVGGAGGKSHPFFITWCVVCNEEDISLNLHLLCDVHM
jgi:hypothetical protein